MLSDSSFCTCSVLLSLWREFSYHSFSVASGSSVGVSGCVDLPVYLLPWSELAEPLNSTFKSQKVLPFVCHKLFSQTLSTFFPHVIPLVNHLCLNQNSIPWKSSLPHPHSTWIASIPRLGPTFPSKHLPSAFPKPWVRALLSLHCCPFLPWSLA